MKSFLVIAVCCVVLSSLIGACNNASNQATYTPTQPGNQTTYTPSQPSNDYTPSQPSNDYQDMRSRGHSEEDAVIFSILKQQGYSDYEAVNAMQSSKDK